MSFKVQQGKKLDNVVIVSRYDDALDLESFEWEDYTEDYDYSKLKFVADKYPTKFVCNFKFNAEEAAEIKNSSISGFKGNDARITLGTWQQNIARFGLKDVVYDPEDQTPPAERLTIKKSGKYLRDDTLSLLEEAGVVSEIFAAYNVLTSDAVKGNEKN